jgi:hypothetical protein
MCASSAEKTLEKFADEIEEAAVFGKSAFFHDISGCK